MSENVPQIFADDQQSRFLATVRHFLKSSSLVLAPWLGGIALWVGSYLVFCALRFEYRGLAIPLGALIWAVLLKRQRIPWRGVLVGAGGCYVIIVLGLRGEIDFGTRYQLENLRAILLLTPEEKFTAWHFGGGLWAFCCFLFWRRAGTEENWLERYTWTTGAFLTDAKQLAALFDETRRRTADAGLDFAMLCLPSIFRTKNFLFSGKIGSGKTTYLKKLMASALKAFRKGSDQRALIYDYKAEFYPFLLALGLKVPILKLNPFEITAAWWNLADEITDSKTAHQVAAGFVPDANPDKPSDAQFWVDKARGVLAGLMISFHRHSPGRWTFRDVCLALRERPRYEAILQRDQDTATIVLSLEHEDTRGDVWATLDTHRWKYEIVAALWEHARRNGNSSFTIRDWLKDSAVLLMTQDKSGGEILNPIYQAILRCLNENMASQQNSDDRATWLFLDEFPTLGRIPLMDELLNTGRSRGAATVVTFQDIQQVRTIYGEYRTDAILAAFDCKAIFKSSTANAKWAQEVFLNAEYYVERKSSGFSVTKSDTGASRSFSESIHASREEVPLFRSAFFTYLASPTPKTGFSAAFMIDNCAFQGTEKFKDAIHSIPKPRKTAGYSPGPSQHQDLHDWKPEDYKRLRLDLILQPSDSKPATTPDASKKVPPITIKRKR